MKWVGRVKPRKWIVNNYYNAPMSEEKRRALLELEKADHIQLCECGRVALIRIWKRGKWVGLCKVHKGMGR